MAKYIFSWGEPYGIREYTNQFMKYDNAITTQGALYGDLKYPPHEGCPNLIAAVKDMIYKTTGLKYEHVVLTSGATGALNIFTQYQKQIGGVHTVTVPSRGYFAFYPMIAKSHGLDFKNINGTHNVSYDSPIARLYSRVPNSISFVDSPSNPLGKQYGGFTLDNTAIWDASYHSETFNINTKNTPVCNFMAGSVGKWTGLTGLRVGWLAFNGDIYKDVYNIVTSAYCGISSISQDEATRVFKKILDSDKFFKDTQNIINNNREEIAKLKYLFQTDMSEVGMFYVGMVDEKVRKILEKASVEVTEGINCGLDYNEVRVNLAHTNATTRQMVQAIIKADKLR